jgi:hypothetical protein
MRVCMVQLNRAYMKNGITVSAIILVVGLFDPQITTAQGTTTFLSNLGQTPDGTNPVGSDSWLAAGVLTGNNAGGYVLNSVQFTLTDASGNPGGFTAMLCSANIGIGINPGNNLGTLTGSADPRTGGTYTYAAVSSISLSPHTYYFIVLTAGTTVANGAYEWNFMNTSAYQPQDGWGATVTLSSGNGSTWTILGSDPNYFYSQFALMATATPTPEPCVLGLFVLGGLLVAFQRRKARS